MSRRLGSRTGRLTRVHMVQLISFGLNGASTGIVYSVAVWSLLAISRKTFELDVVIAYAISIAANYLGARLVFKPTTGIRGHALRYLSVVASNFLTTAVLAWWLHRAGADNIISVYLPVAVTSIPTFVLMRNWVFKNPVFDELAATGVSGDDAQPLNATENTNSTPAP
jgi:putative flippase GtrA